MDMQAVLAPGYTLKPNSPTESTLTWSTDGRSVTLSGATLIVAQQFATPQSVDDVVHLYRNICDTSVVLEEINRLLDKGVLICAGDANQVLPNNPLGLFGAPVVSVQEAVKSDVEIVVLGVPYDLGTSFRPGARFGPESIRRSSRSIFEYNDLGTGMFDPSTGRRALEGVRLRDVGDLPFDVHLEDSSYIRNVQQIVEAVSSAGKFVVTIGGDHSISAPLIRGISLSRKPMGVLHIDAHFDYSGPTDSDFVGLNHANFLNWSAADKNVDKIIQCGVRQRTKDMPLEIGKRVVFPGNSWLDDPGAVIDCMDSELSWYLTFDVDYLDPMCMPDTGTPLPGGPSWRELEPAMRDILLSGSFVGMDLVEFMPEGRVSSSLMAANILLFCLDLMVGSPNA